MKDADLFAFGLIENLDGVGRALQNHLAVFFLEISFCLRRKSECVVLAGANNDHLATLFVTVLRFVQRQNMRSSLDTFGKLLLAFLDLFRQANEHIMLVGLSINGDGTERGFFDSDYHIYQSLPSLILYYR